MLNLNCVICAELFTQSDDVHITHCGHMFHIVCLKQWMERSKSCPQCRNKCTDRNIFRVYFNLANLDLSHIDVGSLQEQLDNAMLQVKIKDKEIKLAQDQIKNLKDIQKKCMKTIAGLESKLEKNDFVILSYTEQLKLLRTEVKGMSDLQNELNSLRKKIETMEGISAILTGSSADAEKLLKSESDSNKLAVWVTTLKRELRNSETKKTELRNVLKVVQKDMRKEIEAKKKYEERISQLESENYQLTEQVQSLESINIKSQTSSSSNASMSGPIVSSIIHQDRRSTISPSIKENIKNIEESNSPYLNIKASSIGFVPLFKRQHEGTSGNSERGKMISTSKIATLKISPHKNTSTLTKDVKDKLSIFKKPRLGMVTASTSAGSTSQITSLGSNYVFNGFGGSEKIDPFCIKSDSDEDENDVSSRVRKIPISISGNKVTSSVTGSLSLSNRMKTGSLRNFKISK